MSVKRSKSSRRFVISVFSVVFSAICVSGGDLESPNGYVASVAPDSNYRGYGSDLASNRGYSITPSELTYHSSDPVSVPLSQLRDDDGGDVTFISSPQTVAENSQVPPLANLVRYIILKEYHVLQDGTMVSANGGTIIRNAAKSASSYSSPSVKSGGGSSSGGYTVSSSSGGYSPPSSSSGGYSSKPSGGYSSSSSGGYTSRPSGGYTVTTSSGGGYSAPSGGYSLPTVEIKQIAGLYGPPGKSSVRRPNLPLMNEPEIEITRVELPEDESDEGLINAAVNSVNSGRGGSGGSVSGRNSQANIYNEEDASDQGLINAAVNSFNSGRGGSGGSVSGRLSQANNNNDGDETEDPENSDDGNQDNVDNEGDDDDNSEDDNNGQDNNDIDDDDDGDNDGEEEEEDTSAALTSSRNVGGANTRQPNNNRNNNNNRQRNNAVSSSGGSSSANVNNSTFQVTPVRGVTLSSSNNNNNPASSTRNTNRPQSSNNRPRTQNQVLTDAFMFSEPSAEITSVSGSARPLQEQRAQTTTSNRNPARINSSNSRQSNNRRRNRNRNRSRNNRNRSRGNSRRNRNRNRGNSSRSNNSSTTITSTTTTAAPVSSEEELKPIILPTQASPQLQEALQLVAQFAQQQSELLSRTKQQAKSIAGSVFNSLTIPNFGLGTLSGNASSPYPQSLAPVSANQVSITTLRESNTTADSDASSSNQTPGTGGYAPSISEQPPNSSSASSIAGTYGNIQILPGFSSSSGIAGFQFGQNSSPPPSLSATLATTYGAPSQNLPSLTGSAQGNINHLTNIHQQLAGLKAGFRSGILSSVQNAVAAVHSKGETGTTSTSPSTVYGPPTTPSSVYGPPPTPSNVYGPPAQNNFQIIKAVKGHFANKGQGVLNHFVNKGSVIRNHFASKGQIVRGNVGVKGSAASQLGKLTVNHFATKGALTQKVLTQKAATIVDAKHMQIQNVIKHIQTIFKHNPALTAW